MSGLWWNNPWLFCPHSGPWSRPSVSRASVSSFVKWRSQPLIHGWMRGSKLRQKVKRLVSVPGISGPCNEYTWKAGHSQPGGRGHRGAGLQRPSQFHLPCSHNSVYQVLRYLETSYYSFIPLSLICLSSYLFQLKQVGKDKTIGTENKSVVARGWR